MVFHNGDQVSKEYARNDGILNCIFQHDTISRRQCELTIPLPMGKTAKTWRLGAVSGKGGGQASATERLPGPPATAHALVTVRFSRIANCVVKIEAPGRIIHSAE
jgi:hypothetical protein